MLTATLPDPADAPPEVLIAGAGAVGLVLGIALARAGRRVLILEAGPATPPVDYAAHNAGPNNGVTHLGLTEGRMKALGGTTRLWGGQLVPFGSSDFRPTYAGKPAWPIDHATLAPYFARAFDFVGIDDTARDPAHIWSRIGGAPPDLGSALEPTMNIWLPVADFAKLFADDIRTLPALTVVTDAEVTGLEFASDGRVAAVSVGASRVSARQVVLANGTLEICRLLLRAVALPHCPFAANPYIGRGFIDHLHGLVGRVVPRDVAKLRAGFENMHVAGRKYSVKIRASDAFLEEHGLASCAATFNASGSIRQAVSDIADLTRRLFARGHWRSLGSTVSEAARTLRLLLPIVWTYAVRRRSHSLFDRGILLGLEIEQIPNEKSYLFLDRESTQIGVHWGFDGRELGAARLFCAELARVLEASGYGTVELDPRIETADPALFELFHDAYHQMGGARMATRPEDGVVDADLRVFGSANLSVLGAAVFPSGSFANPTLTAMALAHRLADRLNEELDR